MSTGENVLKWTRYFLFFATRPSDKYDSAPSRKYSRPLLNVFACIGSKLAETPICLHCYKITHKIYQEIFLRIRCDGYDNPIYTSSSGDIKIWPRAAGYWYFGPTANMCTDSLNAYYDPNANGGTQNFWKNIQNTMKFYDGSVGDFVEIQRKLAEKFLS